MAFLDSESLVKAERRLAYVGELRRNRKDRRYLSNGPVLVVRKS